MDEVPLEAGREKPEAYTVNPAVGDGNKVRDLREFMSLKPWTRKDFWLRNVRKLSQALVNAAGVQLCD